MSTTPFSWQGNPDVPTSVSLTVMRVDTSAIVLNAVALTPMGGGLYRLVPDLTDPAPGLQYNVTMTWVYTNGASGSTSFRVGGGGYVVGSTPAAQSDFEASMVDNLDEFYTEFGLAGIYVAPDGASVSGITVRVYRDKAHQVERPSRTPGEMQTGEILMRQSELAKPVKNGRFTVRGVEVWTIEMTPTLTNGEWLCSCVRTGVERMMDRRALV